MVAAAVLPAKAGGGVVRAFSEEAARPLVRAIVNRQLPLFSSFRDISKADLVQEGLRVALEIHAKYDPARGAYSTFLYTRLPNRLTDYLRSRTAQHRREEGTAQRRGLPVALAHPNERTGPDDLADDAPLHEWLGRVYRAIVQMARAAGGNPAAPTTPARPRAGRPATFTPAQRMALTALMRRQKLSTRGVVALLAEREDLRRAIQLRRVPGQSWVVKSGKKVIPNSPFGRICFD